MTTPPKDTIALGHNPLGLTLEQVGEGWELFHPGETVQGGCGQRWNEAKQEWEEFRGIRFAFHRTYRRRVEQPAREDLVCRCIKCGCLWRQNWCPEHPSLHRTWSLYNGQQKACPTCDNSPDFQVVRFPAVGGFFQPVAKDSLPQPPPDLGKEKPAPISQPTGAHRGALEIVHDVFRILANKRLLPFTELVNEQRIVIDALSQPPDLGDEEAFTEFMKRSPYKGEIGYEDATWILGKKCYEFGIAHRDSQKVAEWAALKLANDNHQWRALAKIERDHAARMGRAAEAIANDLCYQGVWRTKEEVLACCIKHLTAAKE